MPPPQQLLSSGVSTIRWLNARCQSSVALLVFFTLLAFLPLRSSSPSSTASSPSNGSQLCPTAREWIDLHGNFCFTLLNSTYLKNSTELVSRQPRAIQMFCEMDRILEKIDCDQPFSVNVERNQCALCREAFRDWSCSMLIDTTDEGLIDCATSLMPCPSCASICHRVMRLCPYLSPDRVQPDLTGNAHPHVSQYGGHPAFYCPEETFHPSDPAYNSHSSFCYNPSDYCNEPHRDSHSSDSNSNHNHNNHYGESEEDEFNNHHSYHHENGNGDVFNGYGHNSHRGEPEKHYTSCCWAYASESAVADDASAFISSSSLNSEGPNWSSHVAAYDSGSYNYKQPGSNLYEQLQSDTRVILNCCDGNGDCKVSDGDIESSQQSHSQKLATYDDNDNKSNLKRFKKARTSRSRSSNIDTYGSDIRYRKKPISPVDEDINEEIETEGEITSSDLLFLGGAAAAEQLPRPERAHLDIEILHPQPPAPTVPIDYEDELLLDTDSDIDSENENEIEGGSSSSTESEDLLTSDLELDDGDDYHRHSRRSNIDINGRSVIISSSSSAVTNVKHKNAFRKSNLIITTSKAPANPKSYNLNYNSRQKSKSFMSSPQQPRSNVNTNTRFQNNDYKIHHNQKDEFMAIVMGDRRVTPVKSSQSGFTKNAALRSVRAAAAAATSPLGNSGRNDGVKVSSDAGTSSTFMTLAFASNVYSAPRYNWESGKSSLSPPVKWSSNTVLLSFSMKTLSSASYSSTTTSSAPRSNHTTHHDCCSSVLFLLLILTVTTTNFLPIYYLLGFTTTDTCQNINSDKECKEGEEISTEEDVRGKENDVDTKSIATTTNTKNNLDRMSKRLRETKKEKNGCTKKSLEEENVQKLLACYLTEEEDGQKPLALLLQLQQQLLTVMNLRLRLILIILWTLKSSRQLVLYKFLRIALKHKRPTITVGMKKKSLLCPLQLNLKSLLLLVVHVAGKNSQKLSRTYYNYNSKEILIPVTRRVTLRHIIEKKTSRRNCRILVVLVLLSLLLLLFLKRKRRMMMRQKQYHTEFYYTTTDTTHNNTYLLNYNYKSSTISDNYSKLYYHYYYYNILTLSQLIITYTNFKQNKDLIQIETTKPNTTTTKTNKNNKHNTITKTTIGEYKLYNNSSKKSIVSLLQSVHLLNDCKNAKGLLHLFNIANNNNNTKILLQHYYYNCNYDYYVYIDSHNNIVVHYYYSGQGPGQVVPEALTPCPLQRTLLLLLLLLLLMCETRWKHGCCWYYYYYVYYYYYYYYNYYDYYSYVYNYCNYQRICYYYDCHSRVKVNGYIRYSTSNKGSHIPSPLLLIVAINERFVTRQFYSGSSSLSSSTSCLCHFLSNLHCLHHPSVVILQSCRVFCANTKSEPVTRGNSLIRSQVVVASPSYFHVCSIST